MTLDDVGLTINELYHHHHHHRHHHHHHQVISDVDAKGDLLDNVAEICCSYTFRTWAERPDGEEIQWKERIDGCGKSTIKHPGGKGRISPAWLPLKVCACDGCKAYESLGKHYDGHAYTFTSTGSTHSSSNSGGGGGGANGTGAGRQPVPKVVPMQAGKGMTGIAVEQVRDGHSSPPVIVGDEEEEDELDAVLPVDAKEEDSTVADFVNEQEAESLLVRKQEAAAPVAP